MDALITAAGRALRAGDPLGALDRVALRDDPAALALRGIAMAQLGDLPRARELLRRAARGFSPRETLARARCLTAEAEVALAARELGAPLPDLAGAVRTFTGRGDRENALHARLLQVRRLLLIGRVEEAAAEHAKLQPVGAPDRLTAITFLVAYEIALRRGHASEAKKALLIAGDAATRSGIGALMAEIRRAGEALVLPAARLVSGGEARALTLAEVELLFTPGDLVIDACRRVARRGPVRVRLAQRPALFSLLQTLAESWPGEASREVLIARAFEVRRPNASHRARLRVAIGRLRQELGSLAQLRATARGFVLEPANGATLRLLVPPIDTPDASLLALLADGEAWSTSALAQAQGASQRTVQRALTALQQAGQVRSVGAGRSRRWLAAPVTQFATPLLLPVWDGPG